MRTFKRVNVVKVTNNEQKAAQLLAEGFVEIFADKSEPARKIRNKKAANKEAADGGDNDGEPSEAEDTAGNNGQ